MWAAGTPALIVMWNQLQVLRGMRGAALPLSPRVCVLWVESTKSCIISSCNYSNDSHHKLSVPFAGCSTLKPSH